MISWYFLVLIILSLSYAFTVLEFCFNSVEADKALKDGLLPALGIICVLDIPITMNTGFIQDGQLI